MKAVEVVFGRENISDEEKLQGLFIRMGIEICLAYILLHSDSLQILKKVGMVFICLSVGAKLSYSVDPILNVLTKEE